VVRRRQPLHEFVLVAQRAVVAVGAVQKGNAHHVIGDLVDGIEVAKYEAATAAVAAEHRLHFVPGEKLLHRGNDLGNQLVTVFLAPGRPAPRVGFEIHDDNRAVLDKLPQEAGLSGDVLDVVMPVIARL